MLHGQVTFVNSTSTNSWQKHVAHWTRKHASKSQEDLPLFCRVCVYLTLGFPWPADFFSNSSSRFFMAVFGSFCFLKPPCEVMKLISSWASWCLASSLVSASSQSYLVCVCVGTKLQPELFRREENNGQLHPKKRITYDLNGCNQKLQKSTWKDETNKYVNVNKAWSFTDFLLPETHRRHLQFYIGSPRVFFRLIVSLDIIQALLNGLSAYFISVSMEGYFHIHIFSVTLALFHMRKLFFWGGRKLKVNPFWVFAEVV